tara:strand:- start:260 stop:379 length:120 start_codon:yes stop_codon:yes gene_type:complete
MMLLTVAACGDDDDGSYGGKKADPFRSAADITERKSAEL